jgi:excisionase family DNA binding protein
MLFDKIATPRTDDEPFLAHRRGCDGACHQPLKRRAWTPKEVAEQLGVPYETVLDLIHANRIGATKAGRYYLVPDFELERFLDGARKAA